MTAPYLEVAGLSKSFGAARVLETLDIAVGKGELVTLLGPSGCGKTTLLRAIAGLERPDAGSIKLGGRDIAKVPAHKRDIGVVFQSYALFPHLTVAENVAFGLRARGMGKTEREAEVVRALGLVRMDKFADRRITALSGGQQQRVALARALAIRPSLMLFDEALSALDRKLREAMQIELKQLLRTLGFTAIFVSHDQDEALAMSDRIAVMNAGRIEQFAAPEALYRRPTTPFVLDFVGLSTRFVGKVMGPGRVHTAVGPVMAPTDGLAVGSNVTVAIRPECFQVNAAAPDNHAELVVADTMFLGARVIAFGTTATGDRLLVELPATPNQGDRIAIGWSQADTMVFPGMTQRIAALAAPAGLYLLVAYGAALALLFLAAPPSAYMKVVGDPYYRMVAWNTVRLAVLVTIASLIVAYPAALALARTRGVLQVVLLGAAFLPLSVGVVAKTFGWTVLLRRDGVINDLLMALHLIDEPQRLLFTEVGLILGTANIFLPFMLLPIFTVATQIDRRLYDAAATLGSGPVLTFLRVTLPLTGPGIAAGVTLVFAMTLSAYVVPTLLAGDRYPVLSIQIAKAFLLARDPELGSALGVTLLVLAGGAMALGGIRKRR